METAILIALVIFILFMGSLVWAWCKLVGAVCKLIEKFKGGKN